MSSQTPPQNDLDLQALDVVLDSLSRLSSDASTEREDFYKTVASQIAACTESAGAVVIVKNTKGQSRFLHQHGWERFSPSQIDALNQAIKKIVSDLPTQPSQTQSGVAQGGSHRLIFSFCKPLSQMQFVFLLVRARGDNELAEQVFRDLTSEVSNQIEIFENAKSAAKNPRSVIELTQIAQLVQNLGKASNQVELAFHLVNDLAKVTRADRVTFFNSSGRILAISGVAKVSQQTEIAKNLSKLARLTLKAGGIEWRSDRVEIDGQRKPRGLNELVRSIPADSGIATPISKKNPSLGVLLFEYFESETGQANEKIDFNRRELVNEAIDFASPVVERTRRVFSIPGIQFLDWLFNRLVIRSVRNMLSFAFTLGLLAALGYWLFALQAPFEIYGEGTLEAAEKIHVFTHVDGKVEQLLVKEGALVEPDQQLLLIRSKDLENEIVTVRGRIEEAETEQRTLSLSDLSQREDGGVDETQTASEIQRIKIRLQTLNAQLAFLEEKEQQLVIRSPIRGQVTTQNLEQKLIERPVDRKDLLMTISNTAGQWELELSIPDNRVEFIKAALAEAQASDPEATLNVIFRLAADSQKTYTGSLREIDYRASFNGENDLPSVTAFVSIDENELGDSLRLGSRVYGKVACGERSNFFLLTYEARNKINQWLFR